MPYKTVVLMASPKKSGSASEFIADLFVDAFKARGITVEKHHLYNLLLTAGGKKVLLSSIGECDILIISTPLYIDGPPYIVTLAMDLLVANSKGGKDMERKKMFVVSNGGYPEASHNKVALDIFREFAERSSFQWQGGLAVGMGAVLNVAISRKLKFLFNTLKRQVGGIVNKILDEVVEKDAEYHKAAPFMPLCLYVWGSRIAARCMAGRNLIWKLYRRPYA